MKRAAGAGPGPEGRSRFQKVSLVSRRLENAGSTRGREGSPSRVSLLLQAWEREIVEKTATGPSTPTRRERCSTSISLLRDFAAHGPIFSQVYSPAQKPRRQDERGKVGTGGGSDGGDGNSPPTGTSQEMPVHRESYVHGTLLPTRPTEHPAAGPGEGPGAPCTVKPGCTPALPRARHVTVLRTGRDAAGTQSRVAEGRKAPNGTHDAAGAAVTPPQQESQGQDGSESSAGTTEAAGLVAEGCPGDEHSPQAEAEPVRATLSGGDRPGDPQTSRTSSPQCPSEDAGSQAGPAGAGEGSVAGGDSTIPATPLSTESPPEAGSTPEDPCLNGSDAPEPSSKAPAPPEAEVELEGSESMQDPQGTAQELENSPEPPCEPPAPDPRAESAPDAAEEDPELLVDMEIFVDTLRNMEPSEMRRAPRAPRQPRPSSLGRCAALPPIQEDRVASRAPISLPEALRELLERDTVEQQEESPEEEIENPYLSPEERALVGTPHRVPGDSVARGSRAEGGSLLGTLRQVEVEENARAVARSLADCSVPCRGSVLKGMALLSHFLEHRDEGKPHSRLDSSVLYSRFVCPTTAQLQLPARDGAGMGLPIPGGDNGLSPGDQPGPGVAMLEVPGTGCITPVPEEPDCTMASYPADVLVSGSCSVGRGSWLCPPGHVGSWWGLSPRACSQHMALVSHQRGHENPWCDGRVLGWVTGGC